MLTTIPLYGKPHPIFAIDIMSYLPSGYDLRRSMGSLGRDYSEAFSSYLSIASEMDRLTRGYVFIKYNALFREYCNSIFAMIHDLQAIMATSIINIQYGDFRYIIDNGLMLMGIDITERIIFTLRTDSVLIPAIPHHVCYMRIDVNGKSFNVNQFHKSEMVINFMYGNFYDAYMAIYKKYCYMCYQCSLMANDRFRQYNQRVIVLFQKLIESVEITQRLSVSVLLKEILLLKAKIEII